MTLGRMQKSVLSDGRESADTVGGSWLPSPPQEGAMTLHWADLICTVSSLRGILWQISVSSQWGLKVHGGPWGGAATYCTYKGLAFSMNHDTLSIHGIRNKRIKQLWRFRFVMPESGWAAAGGMRGLWLSFMRRPRLIYEPSFSAIKSNVV